MDPVIFPTGSGITLTLDQVKDILAESCAHPDEEACGLVAGIQDTARKIYPVTNCLHSPTQFLMQGAEQVKALLDIESHSWELIAIYHSHLHGPPEPSETDKEKYSYPGVAYLIIDLSGDQPVMRGFQLRNGAWTEIPIGIIGEQQL